MSLVVNHRRIISRGDIPGSNGGIFNPGAVLMGSNIFMLCRREIDHRPNPIVFPESVLIDPHTLRVLARRTLKKDGYPEDCRIEDFRCMHFAGELLAVHSVVCGCRAKPAISRVVNGRIEPYDSFELPIALNDIEKNWVLFEHEGDLHCLYRLDPLTIFRRAPARWELVKEEENGWADDFESMLSNSANLIPFRDGYLGFWHSRRDGNYVQGAFLIGKNLRITHKTDVLLDGATVGEGFKPGVLYVSSLVEHAGRILAFYGEADIHTNVAIFDAAQLADALRQSSFEDARPLRLRLHGESMGDVYRALTALDQFSAARGRPRMRLHVTDLRLRPAILAFGIAHLEVREAAPQQTYDAAVYGKSGFIQDLRAEPRPSKLMPLHNKDGTSTCPLGLPMNQNRLAVPVWSYAMEIHPPNRIIELGSYGGGFTTAIGVHAWRIGAKVISFDVMKAPDERFASLALFLGIVFVQADVFSAQTQSQIVELIAQPGVTYLLCDNGDKRREFNLFAPHLKPGDVIAAHDYAVAGQWWESSEIVFEDVAMSVAQNALSPFLQQHFDTAGWLAFIRS